VTYLQAVIALVERKELRILGITEEDRDYIASLPRKLSLGEAEGIALCRRLNYDILRKMCYDVMVMEDYVAADEGPLKDRLREIQTFCDYLADGSVRLVSVVGGWAKQPSPAAFWLTWNWG